MSNIQNQELFQIFETEVNGILIKTVNARELHSFLEVGRKFSTWIKDRIEKYEFVENQDFIIISQNRETIDKNGYNKVSVAIEYAITLDMAKELSMVENNEQGRLARRYFIKCSNKADKVLKLLYSLEYQPKTDLLYLKDNSYVTDSLILSNLVGKHHYRILRDIEFEISSLEENPNLDAPIKSSILNGFYKDTYLSVQGKELPKYVLNEEAALQVLYSFDIESNIHKEFKKYHIRGEWFNTDVKSAIEYLEKARYVLNSSLIDVNGNKIFERITNEYTKRTCLI